MEAKKKNKKKKILSRRTIAIIEDIYGQFIAYPAIKL